MIEHVYPLIVGIVAWYVGYRYGRYEFKHKLGPGIYLTTEELRQHVERALVEQT